MTIIRCPLCGELHEAETWQGTNFWGCPEYPDRVFYVVARDDCLRVENVGSVAG